jgi:signal transduction histidine kinase
MRTLDVTMRIIFRPWTAPGRLWRELCHVALGLVTGTIYFTLTVALVATTTGLLIALPLALPVAWVMFAVGHLLGSLERSRTASLLDLDLADPVDPLRTRGWLRRLKERALSWPRWKEMIHHVVSLPLALLSFALVFGIWCGSVALIGLPAYVQALPEESAKFWLFDVSQGAAAVVAALVGMVGVAVVAPWTTRAIGIVHRRWAGLMLGPRRDALLVETVSRLETSRSAAVDSAEAERRRIERDLHDGAQQRLVALAASLGEARMKLEGGDTDAGQALVAGAHQEAKAALKEIRDLVRGIHPVILEDRGLDAALSAVVARAPVPVSLTVEVPERLPATIESTAYFVVNEALTNVARHSSATRAHVAVVRAADRLIVEIRDDGVGGADASRGTGLQGLRDRVSAVGGTMHVISPDGGPTTISVEVPCAS